MVVGPFNRAHFNPNHFATGHVPSGDARLGGRKEELVITGARYPQTKLEVMASLYAVVENPSILDASIKWPVARASSAKGPIRIPASRTGSLNTHLKMQLAKPSSLQAGFYANVIPLQNSSLMELLKLLNKQYVA